MVASWCCAQCRLWLQSHAWDRAVCLGERQFLGLGTNIRHLHLFSWSRDHRRAKFSESYEYRRGCGEAVGSKAEADRGAPSCSVHNPGQVRGKVAETSPVLMGRSVRVSDQTARF